jgi:hypothetical protein
MEPPVMVVNLITSRCMEYTAHDDGLGTVEITERDMGPIANTFRKNLRAIWTVGEKETYWKLLTVDEPERSVCMVQVLTSDNKLRNGFTTIIVLQQFFLGGNHPSVSYRLGYTPGDIMKAPGV